MPRVKTQNIELCTFYTNIECSFVDFSLSSYLRIIIKFHLFGLIVRYVIMTLITCIGVSLIGHILLGQYNNSEMVYFKTKGLPILRGLNYINIYIICKSITKLNFYHKETSVTRHMSHTRLRKGKL